MDIVKKKRSIASRVIRFIRLGDGSVDPSMLSDPNQARMIAQCDINDGISQLINFNFDEDF